MSVEGTVMGSLTEQLWLLNECWELFISVFVHSENNDVSYTFLVKLLLSVTVLESIQVEVLYSISFFVLLYT